MKRYFDDLLMILEDALNSIDAERFTELVDECVQTLEKGKKIIVSGLGKNVPVCDKFVGTMNSLGLDASFMNTNSAVHGDIGMVHSGDLVIILTKSGETAESIYLNSLLSKRECTQWLLTFEQKSTLTHEIPKHIVISLRHEGDLWNIVPNNSTTLNLLVLQMLAMEIAKKMNISLEQFKMNHPGGHIGDILRDAKNN